MRRANLAEPELTFDDEDPPGFRAGVFRMGDLLGAQRLGTSLYLLPPGEALCPYHWEAGEEEWLLVLAGTPSIRHPEGTDVLQPLDVVCFPAGPDGAHQVRNDSPSEDARVLMWSNVEHPAVTTYPDSDKVGVHQRDVPSQLFRRSTEVGYYDGETGADGR